LLSRLGLIGRPPAPGNIRLRFFCGARLRLLGGRRNLVSEQSHLDLPEGAFEVSQDSVHVEGDSQGHL
jgi:hypothetical protein